MGSRRRSGGGVAAQGVWSLITVRYYLYVSDAKIDMLFEQIPKRLLDRLTKELKIDIKVVSVTVKEREQDARGSGA